MTASTALAEWRAHPAKMVRDLFKVDPDVWQEEALEAFPHTSRLAMQACTGPGKTALLAWLGWNFMLTRPHPVIGCASINADNLKANLWTELSRWYQASPLLQDLFVMQKTEILSREHPNTWKIEARSWARDADQAAIGNALRGLHAQYIMWLLDECGAMADAVLPTCEAIFSGEPAEAHIAMAGNPTNLSGPLYTAATKARSDWKVIEITADPDDPRRTPRVSKEHAEQQIRLYGRDNPWVLINIFGRFPPGSLNALIGPDEVSAAMKRSYRDHEIGQASKVIGVDVARFGDDKSVMAKRQGVQMFNFRVARNIDSTQGAGWVMREALEWSSDATFVDDTGGFGAGWIDQMRALGHKPVGVAFSGEAANKGRYFNKRTEMAFELVEWIKSGGALPDCPELLSALTQTTYAFKGDKMLLEPKDDVKKKLGYSPDEMDAAMLTFAYPVVPNVDMRRIIPNGQRRHTFEYNPFEAA